MYFYFSFILLFFSLLFFSLGLTLLNYNLSFIIDWEVLTINSSTVSMTLYLDWMSMFFSGVVLVISSMVVLYSYDYMYTDFYKFRFLILVILFIFSMMLMIFSLNLISILLGWDGLGLVSYCLVIYYQNNSSYSSGMLTILTNRVGDVFILIGIGWFFNFGSFHFTNYLFMDYIWLNFFIGLIILASFTKSAQIPFSSWLPAAMAAPTPVSSLVHSSTLVTAGVYLLIRFGNLIITSSMIDYFFVISLLTMFMAGLGANFEYDLKKIVAFSTLSQLGLMMSILFVGGFNLSYFHLLSHAFFKSLLFMCSGLIIHMLYDNQDIRYMGFIFNEKPYMTSCFLIANLSLCGLFFLSGFYSKDLIVESFFYMNMNFFKVLIYLLSVLLTVSYSLRLLNYCMLVGVNTFCFRSVGEGMSSFISLIILVFFSVIFGGLFSWLTFETPFLLIFTIFNKFMVLFFMILGVVLYLYTYNFYMKNIGLFNFLGSMWYLNYHGSLLMNLLFYKVSYTYKSLCDDSWGEFYLSLYMSSLAENFSLKFNYLIFNNLKYYMLSFFLIMIYFMF
uniref:NADH dehydrogenase subunit 5 n=1 Tax=Neoplerochila paliatseasi TaxID=2704509 RepID=UPI0013E956ED|nr:NADH dehydrogenase subunit 5 [Neoplerochila paliatseasi]QHR79407.1 NADH dehydrogenase subunit 5 [Neoplerochila paliatseasi]